MTDAKTNTNLQDPYQVEVFADHIYEAPIVVSSSPDVSSENNSTNALEKKLDGILIESIDEVLTSMGEPVKNTVYINLQSSFNIKKKEIPQNIPDFRIFMNKVLGPSFRVLERRIIQTLDKKVKDELGYSGDSFLCGQLPSRVNLNEYVHNLYRVSLKL